MKTWQKISGKNNLKNILEGGGDNMRKFGRLVQFDERSRKFPIRALIADNIVPRSYTWSCNFWLDQGQTPACTGFSVAHEAAARPVIVPNMTNKIAQEVYRRAQQLDEWEGEDYEGSSVIAAIKAGKERGWYKEYRWAFSEEDLFISVGHHGPAVLGINWYEGMGNTGADGFVQVSGEVLGGHAILCNGVNVKKNRYHLHNSWGISWGINGGCFVTRADMKRLLREEGEACIPVMRIK